MEQNSNTANYISRSVSYPHNSNNKFIANKAIQVNHQVEWGSSKDGELMDMQFLAPKCVRKWAMRYL